MVGESLLARRGKIVAYCPQKSKLIAELGSALDVSTSISSLGITKRLELGVLRFFRAQGPYAPDPPLVFGQAKSIVRRFKTEPDTFEKVESQIEERKRSDANWTYANQINSSLALVNALGLSPETAEDNRVFLLLPHPEL